MYRRRVENLPKDPIYPHDLKKLGYKIDEKDCITSIEHPGEHFQFFITNNDRYNDAQREAMHNCARKEVSARLTRLGLPFLYLPTFTAAPPTSPTPHLPIHSTPLPLLHTKRRIIVIVNRSVEDLAILSYRMLARSGGINVGSAVSIVQEIRDRAEEAAKINKTEFEDEMPGIVILNTGQLLFSHKEGKAMTPTSWDAMPRKSATHPPAQIHQEWNRIEGNKSFEQHIRFVFEKVLRNKEYVISSAELYILGLAEGGDEVVKYLHENQDRHKVAALALTAPISTYAATSDIPLKDNGSYLTFLAKHARAWRLSSWPLNTAETNPTGMDEIKKTVDDEAEQKITLYPCFSGGESQNDECIITTGFKKILDWFEEVKKGGGAEGYTNEVVTVDEEVVRSLKGWEFEEGGGGWEKP